MGRHLWGTPGDDPDGPEVPIARYGGRPMPSDKCLNCGVIRFAAHEADGSMSPCKPASGSKAEWTCALGHKNKDRSGGPCPSCSEGGAKHD